MQIECQGRQPGYEVLLRKLRPRSIVSLRRTLGSYDDVDGLLAEIHYDLRDACAVEGYGAVWHRCLHSGATIECEAFAVIKPQAPAGSQADLRQLPASSMVCVLHDQLDDAPSVYRAASERAESMGYEISGPMHEIYFPVDESSFAVTEIQFPIRRAAGAGPTPQHN